MTPGPSKPFAVLCDYDDTVAVENVAEMLLTRFCTEVWKDYREEFRAGRITLREYQERAFAAVGACRQDMMGLVRAAATLRAGFKELAGFCHEHDMPLAVVTNGLDFYVQALMEREGLEDVPVYSVVTEFTAQGIRYSYPFAAPECPVNWGNCKCRVLELYRQQGYAVAYAGDGRSDFCAAQHADLVFARSHLLAHMRASSLPCVPFEDFFVVAETLKGKTQGTGNSGLGAREGGLVPGVQSLVPPKSPKDGAA